MNFKSIKKSLLILTAALLVLALGGCSAQQPTEPTFTFDPVGPWHIDETQASPASLAEAFPGYGEWGASMEIRSNGQISWFLGAMGWTGTYTFDGGTLRADMTADQEQGTKTWYLKLIDETTLRMEYPGTSLIWVYGDQPDAPSGGDIN